MSFYGKWETWKIVYHPIVAQYGGARCVAFVEAGDHPHAMATFRQQYAGQFFTIESCEKVTGGR